METLTNRKLYLNIWPLLEKHRTHASTHTHTHTHTHSHCLASLQYVHMVKTCLHAEVFALLLVRSVGNICEPQCRRGLANTKNNSAEGTEFNYKPNSLASDYRKEHVGFWAPLVWSPAWPFSQFRHRHTEDIWKWKESVWKKHHMKTVHLYHWLSWPGYISPYD